MFDDWNRWACPGINCTDIDKHGRGVIRYKKLNKKQKEQADKSEERYWKDFIIYSALWFITMTLGLIFKWNNDLMCGVLFLGMFGWMYVPFMFA